MAGHVTLLRARRVGADHRVGERLAGAVTAVRVCREKHATNRINLRWPYSIIIRASVTTTRESVKVSPRTNDWVEDWGLNGDTMYVQSVTGDDQNDRAAR